jgi:hypothetical protein
MRHSLDAQVDQIDPYFRANLAGKMEDLNRRSFRDKVTLLAAQWNVPLNDIPSKGLEKAINARHRIIHRGQYYDDPTINQVDPDLWEHIVLAREIIVRMVLTVIGFNTTWAV